MKRHHLVLFGNGMRWCFVCDKNFENSKDNVVI